MLIPLWAVLADIFLSEWASDDVNFVGTWTGEAAEKPPKLDDLLLVLTLVAHCIALDTSGIHGPFWPKFYVVTG